MCSHLCGCSVACDSVLYSLDVAQEIVVVVLALEVAIGDELVEVFDANGELKATYIFIYFGDIDGDGVLSSADAFIAEDYEATYAGMESHFGYASYVAADINGDGMVGGDDGFAISEYEVTYEGVDYQYNLGQVAVNNTYEWIY